MYNGSAPTIRTHCFEPRALAHCLTPKLWRVRGAVINLTANSFLDWFDSTTESQHVPFDNCSCTV